MIRKINEFFLKHPIIEGVFSGAVCGLMLFMTFYIILKARGF